MSHYFENDMNLKSEIRELSYKYDSSFSRFIAIMVCLVKRMSIMEANYY